MYKRIPFTLDADLAASDTLDLGFIDKITISDAGHRAFANGTRFDSPTDFTIESDPDTSVGTLTWLSGTTLPAGTVLIIGVAMMDTIAFGLDGGGGGGGGGDVNLNEIDGTPVATDAGNSDTGTQRVVIATNQTAIATSSTTIGAGSDAVGANTLVGQAKKQNQTLGGVSDTNWSGTGDGSINAKMGTVASALLDNTPAQVFREPCSYLDIAESQSNIAVGNVGDLLVSLLIIPENKNPGAVSIGDGATATRTIFGGGTDSVSTLIPWPVDMQEVAAATQHRVTTGADVSVRAFFRAR